MLPEKFKFYTTNKQRIYEAEKIGLFYRVHWENVLGKKTWVDFQISESENLVKEGIWKIIPTIQNIE